MIDWSQRAFLLGVVAVSSLHECEWRGKLGQIVFLIFIFTYLCLWLCQVLVAAHRIFSYGKWDLVP